MRTPYRVYSRLKKKMKAHEAEFSDAKIPKPLNTVPRAYFIQLKYAHRRHYPIPGRVIRYSVQLEGVASRRSRADRQGGYPRPKMVWQISGAPEILRRPMTRPGRSDLNVLLRLALINRPALNHAGIHPAALEVKVKCRG